MKPLALKVAFACVADTVVPVDLLNHVVATWRRIDVADVPHLLSDEDTEFDVLLLCNTAPPIDSSRTMLPVVRLETSDVSALRARLLSAANLATARAMRDSVRPRAGSDIVQLRPEPPRLDDFKLHFQPQWSIDGKRIVGAEALLRWHGLEVPGLKPETVIADAVARGEIARVGDFVMKRALWQLAEWRALWPAQNRVALNLSPSQLDTSFVDSLMDALDRYRLDGTDLELEVAARDLPIVLRSHSAVLNDLLDLGVGFCVDKLGAELIDPATIAALPLTTFKIDRDLISHITLSDIGSLVRELIALGHDLDVRTVAVGVENEWQRELLTDLGCDAVQGFLFAEALPAEQFSALLRAHHERRRQAS